ncbi:Hypothetical predicted protein [Octopus vulgaris]|uniref:Uncharacterized protein n=1 Tax=Octopus vulgaris TaxID=6645 RepID=A0AA36ANJ5_OCTVU|nr:Hypothetical predicted protein [Octopus vulgaris]
MYTHPFDTQFFNVCDKTYCMNRIYPTTLPFNKRVYIPRRTNDHMEAQFTIARTKLRQILGLYIKRQRQNKTDAQQLGIKPACGLQKLIQRTRNGEVICLPTDKSGRMSIDSLPNYIQAMQPHIANTKVTTVQAHEEREKVLNAHMMMWTIVLGPQKRTAKNFQAWNNDIPALYGLRKDHKGFTDPIAGPPTRPVCGANIASNYRISYFLSMIIRPIIRMSPDVCDSTEDLLSRISDCNKTCDLTGCIIDICTLASFRLVFPNITGNIEFDVPKAIEEICTFNMDVYMKIFTHFVSNLLKVNHKCICYFQHDGRFALKIFTGSPNIPMIIVWINLLSQVSDGFTFYIAYFTIPYLIPVSPRDIVIWNPVDNRVRHKDLIPAKTDDSLSPAVMFHICIRRISKDIQFTDIDKERLKLQGPFVALSNPLRFMLMLLLFTPMQLLTVKPFSEHGVEFDLQNRIIDIACKAVH